MVRRLRLIRTPSIRNQEHTMLRVKVNSPRGPATGKPRAMHMGKVPAARTLRAHMLRLQRRHGAPGSAADEYCGEQTCLSVATPPQFSEGTWSWADGHRRSYVKQLLGAGGALVLTEGEEPRTLGVRSAAWGGVPGIGREKTWRWEETLE